MSRRPASPRSRGTSEASPRAVRRGPVTAGSGSGRTRESVGTQPRSATDGLPGRARILSARTLVLGVTLLVGFTIVFPTVRAYLAQQARLTSLRAEVTLAEQQEKDLQAELDRWGTDAYVVAQARERLGYVMPGETAYRVVDPESVVEAPAVQSIDPASESGAALPVGSPVAPWYSTIWDSVQLAGASEVASADGVDGGAEK